jgi:predicted transcriptional regulator
MSNKVDVLKTIEFYKSGIKASKIAKIFGVSTAAINYVLTKNGLREKNQSYSPKITAVVSDSILCLHNNGKTLAEISEVVGITKQGIRQFLKRNQLIPNVPVQRDRSRPCVICGTLFTPAYDDGIKKDKYKTCSRECTGKLISLSKTKYTSEQIDKAIELKKRSIPNAEISQQLSIDINKVKEITKDNNLYLTPEQRQKNAYEEKLKQNPNAMKDMKQAYLNQASSPESLEKIKEILKEKGYEYVDGFQMKSKPFTVRCLTCQKTKETSKINTIHKNSCMNCSSIGTSKAEQDILAWIQQYYASAIKFKFPKADDARGRAKEIDIYIPELKLGIEYCGLYWHSENELDEDNADENKHYLKMLKANELGIRLITIFENEWKEREAQIKGYILSTIGKNTTKIAARDCELKEIDKKISQAFLDAYHIQGRDSSLVSFGLLHNNELVGVMTGGNHPRKSSKKSKVLYLNRLAFKSDVTIVGGASKLLSALKQYAKANKFTEIHSWSDNRWSEGSVYKTLGFTFSSQREKGRGLKDGSIWPEFYYAMDGNLHSRAAIKRMGLNERDLTKVYDCGKKRWILSLLF